MSRKNLPVATLQKQTVHGVLIAELDHPDGIVRMHTGTTNLTIHGTTYLGAGNLLEIEGLNDDSVSEGPHTWRMGLSRATPMLVPHVIDDSIRDRGVRLLVSVSDDGIDWTIPQVIKTGRVSTLAITEDGITAECVTAGLDLARVRQRHTLWTDDQQKEYVNANDVSFRNINGILDVEVPWP